VKNIDMTFKYTIAVSKNVWYLDVLEG